MSISVHRFLFLLSSTRRLGNSEQLAYCAAHPLPPTYEQQWVHLQDYPLPEFTDLRHNASFPQPFGNAKILLDATLKATDIVLVTPLYLYNMPAQAKHYLDHWNAWLRIPSLNFRDEMRDKTLWSIVVSSSGKFEAQPLQDTLTLTAQYMRMDWGGMLYGTGSRPNDIQEDETALRLAKSFFGEPRPTVELTAPHAPRANRLQKGLKGH
ncbi:MAG TPA: NAD(P)H-dependent oxidoreductase [Hymenobacter sp.]|jgi:NAD(P)H-dependent FMN reductase